MRDGFFQLRLEEGHSSAPPSRHPDAWPKVMEMMCEGEGQGGRGSPEREELAGIWQKHALLTQVPTPGPRSRPQSSPLNR